MPYCSIRGCTNSSANGIKMSCFPKDPKRREQWKKNCMELGGQYSIIARDNAVLCEFHFTSDQWEKQRADGKKKLKWNAIPTIFGDKIPQIKSKMQYCRLVNPLGQNAITLGGKGENDGEINPNNPKLHHVLIKEHTYSRKGKHSHEKSSIEEVNVSMKVKKYENELQIGEIPIVIEDNICSEEQEVDPLHIEIPSNLKNHTFQLKKVNSHELKDMLTKAAVQTVRNEDESEEMNEHGLFETFDPECETAIIEEGRLLKLQDEYQSLDERTNLKIKYEILQQMYAQSERLRYLMKEKLEEKEQEIKSTVENYEKKVCELKKGIQKIIYYF